MLYVIMIIPDWLLNKMKKEIKHKKVNKIVCMSEKISNYVGLPYN